MKLGKIERLMLELALKVQPTELDELVFSCSQLTEAQKTEAHTPIKLLVTLKKISATNEHFLEALERLFEEISHFEELLEMVRVFRRENPHLNRSSSFSSTIPNLPNGVFAFRPERDQQSRFQKMLLNVSNHTDWIHLEIMVALSPIPDGLKESISKGFELFDRLKQHGCISENDTELLDEFFSSLNLQKPMQLLRKYQEQFPQVIFDDPPAIAPVRAVPTPPQSLHSNSSHNNSSMRSQPSYRSQLGEGETETHLGRTSSLSSPVSLSIYPQPSQPTSILHKSPDEEIYPRNPVSHTSIRASDTPYPTSLLLDERKRKQHSGMSGVAITPPGHPTDVQLPQAKRSRQLFQSYGPGTGLFSLSSNASSESHGHESEWLRWPEQRQQPSIGREPVVPGNQNPSHSYFPSHLPTQESYSGPPPATSSLHGAQQLQHSEEEQQNVRSNFSSLSSTTSSIPSSHECGPPIERQQLSLGNEPLIPGGQHYSYLSSNLPTQESSSGPPAANSTTHGTSVTSASQNLYPQYSQQRLSYEPPCNPVHTQESSAEASSKMVPGERSFPSSNQNTVLCKQQAWRAAGRLDEAPPSINEATTSISAPYQPNTSHSTASATPASEHTPHYQHHPQLSSAQIEYVTAQQVSPNQGHKGRVVFSKHSGPVSMIQRYERSPTYTTNLSYLSGSSLESTSSNLSSISAGTNTLLSNPSSGGETMGSSRGSTLPSQALYGTSSGSEGKRLSSSSPSHAPQPQASNRSSSEGYHPSNGEGEPNLAASGENIKEGEGGGEKQRSWIVRTVSGIFSKLTGSGKKDTTDPSSDEYESCDEDPSTSDS